MIPSLRSCWEMKGLNQKLTAHLLTNPSLMALFVCQYRGPETVNLPRDSQLNIRRQVSGPRLRRITRESRILAQQKVKPCESDINVVPETQHKHVIEMSEYIKSNAERF